MQIVSGYGEGFFPYLLFLWDTVFGDAYFLIIL